jgi:insulysin
MIQEMSSEAFEKHVAALAVRRLETPKKLSVQNAKYWSEITNQLYNFNRGKVLVDEAVS